MKPSTLTPSTWFLCAGSVALAAAAIGPLVLTQIVVAQDALADDEPTSAGPAALPGTPPARGPAPSVVAADLDRRIAAAQEKEGLRANPRCSDEEFVRRVHLDIVGTIPTAAQVEEFLKDPLPDRRARLVDTLLASPGYARHFANQWSDVLVGTGTGDKKQDFVPSLFIKWMEQQLASDRPYREWVTELLTAQGTGYTTPAVNFTHRKDDNPTDLAGAVSKAFLGVQIQCAQCHDHPYEDIRQKDFEGFAAFWGRMRIKPADIAYEMFGERAVERERQRLEKDVREAMKTGIPEAEARLLAERRKQRTREILDLPGDARLPRAYMEGRTRSLGEIAKVTPQFLKGAAYKDQPGETRRQALAKWITDQDNPYTARTLANRVWGWFLGRGIVHPVDDFTTVNLPSVPDALDLLAVDTASHGHDPKRLIRIITATRAYQTATSMSGASAAAAKSRSAKAQEFFATGPMKPLTSQQSFDSLNVALGVIADGRALSLDDAGPTALEMEDGRGGMARMAMGGDYDRPDRVKAAMTQAARSFFQTFEDDEGGADATFEGTVPQGLFLMNSRAVNAMLLDPRISVVPRIVSNWKEEKDRIRALFLRTLSREPSAAESARFSKFVREYRATAASGAAPGNPKARRGARSNEDQATAAYSDALWVLISSSEFGSNH